MRRRRFGHAGIGCLICVGGVLSLPYPAAADGGPASAVAQYVEMIPTSGGSQAASVGRPSRSTLSPTAKTALRTVDPVVAEQLAEIATSSAFGAPATAPAGRPAKTDVAPRPILTGASSVSTLGVVDDNAPLVIGLTAILGITSVAMIFAAANGRRQGRRDSSRPGR